MESAGEEAIIFDYLYKEVSAQTGEGVFEALQNFSEVLFDFYIHKKRGKQVIMLLNKRKKKN